MLRPTAAVPGLARVVGVALALILAGAGVMPAGSVPAGTDTADSAPVAVPATAGDARPDPGFDPRARDAALALASNGASATARALGLSAGERLEAVDVVADRDGSRHVRYHRTLDGLRVIGGDLVVHRSPAGALTGVDRATESALGGVPTDDPAVGARRAIRVAGAQPDLAAGAAGSPELVVWAVDGAPRPAWEVEVVGSDDAGSPVRRVEYVDATLGEPIAGWSLLETADGRGRSLYSGTVPLTTTRRSGAFLLKDGSRGGTVTMDLGNRQDPEGRFLAGPVFRDADNVWGNGKASHRQSAAVDAAYGAAATYDYLRAAHGRRGIRGDGVGPTLRVHYGQRFDNAFWNSGCFCMTFGDGGEMFKPLVSLDITAHEMVHGVTANTAGLIYFGESGGLNEATSDILGTMVEFSAGRRTDPGDYYLGEELAKVDDPDDLAFMRRMDQPGADGWSKPCWYPQLGGEDVHLSSGVANLFFYLLAEGTGAKSIGGLPHEGMVCSGTGFPQTPGEHFAGIGRAAAAAIWWRALSVYMTSTTTYLDARDATIRAALDLGSACASVERAWDSVLVPQGYWSCDGEYDEGGNVIGNGGFEDGAAGWTLEGSAQVGVSDGDFPFAFSGRGFAALAGQGTANEGAIYRTVTVPASGTPALRFRMLIASAGETYPATGILWVLVNGQWVWYVDTTWRNNSYLLAGVDLSAWAGQTVQLAFYAVEEASAGGTLFLLDDVSLTPR